MVRHQVRVLDSAGGRRLAAAVEAERFAWGHVAELRDAVRAQLGIETVMLLCLRDDGDEQTHLLQVIGPADASERDPSDERAWRDAVADGMVWAEPGWFERTRSWIDSIASVHEIVQRRSWEFSCLLDLRAGAHEWILKCLPRPFLREVRLLRRLAERTPQHIPVIVAADESRQCLLMERSRGTPLSEIEDLRTWTEAMAAYARIQLDWIGREDELADLGLLDRSLEVLGSDMQRLFADEPAMLAGEADGLTSDEISRLRARAGEIELRCDALARLAIPATIEHGDLWEDNILIEEGRALFLDWTDASIAHPFFSLCSVFAGGVGRGERHALRESYLEPWRERFENVDAAFDLAQLPAALHHAVNYHRFILPMVRTERGARRLLPFFLRRLLDEP